MREEGVVIWFCGLPGSGKTTVAQGVYEKLRARSTSSTWALLSMDELRKKIFPEPRYSDEERDSAYRALVLIASLLSQNGISVILDGTAHKKIWRQLAREECPRFVEVYVKCPVEVSIARETQRKDTTNTVRPRLYLDALERLMSGKKAEGLGKVPGIDEPFEESDSPEIVLDSSSDPPKILIGKVLTELEKLAPEIFSSSLQVS